VNGPRQPPRGRFARPRGESRPSAGLCTPSCVAMAAGRGRGHRSSERSAAFRQPHRASGGIAQTPRATLDAALHARQPPRATPDPSRHRREPPRRNFAAPTNSLSRSADLHNPPTFDASRSTSWDTSAIRSSSRSAGEAHTGPGFVAPAFQTVPARWGRATRSVVTPPGDGCYNRASGKDICIGNGPFLYTSPRTCIEKGRS
jgi:hypothetical protein